VSRERARPGATACGPLTLRAFNDDPAAPCFPGGGPVPGCLGPVQLFLQFVAIANTNYFIRVGSPINGNYVCGRLNIVGPNPGGGTCPQQIPPTGVWMTRAFQVVGPSNNTAWAWCLSKPCCMSVQNLNVPGVPVNSNTTVSRNQLAASFAASIQARCPLPGVPSNGHVVAREWTSTRFPGVFYVQVRCPATIPASQIVLSVGPAGAPCDSQCIVPGAGLNTSGVPCSFNPPIEEFPLSGTDCNGNGEDDLIDVISGASADYNEDGTPDECQTICRADFNNSGALSVQDIFDFLAGYFSHDPRADFNTSGAISVQDIFDFLAAYFAGCA